MVAWFHGRDFSTEYAAETRKQVIHQILPNGLELDIEGVCKADQLKSVITFTVGLWHQLPGNVIYQTRDVWCIHFTWCALWESIVFNKICSYASKMPCTEVLMVSLFFCHFTGLLERSLSIISVMINQLINYNLTEPNLEVILGKWMIGIANGLYRITKIVRNTSIIRSSKTGMKTIRDKIWQSSCTVQWTLDRITLPREALQEWKMLEHIYNHLRFAANFEAYMRPAHLRGS